MLTFRVFGLLLLLWALASCSPKVPEAKPVAKSPFEAQVIALEGQLATPDGLKAYLDPVVAKPKDLFSWDPTGKSTNQVLFRMRDAKVEVHERVKLISRMIVALSKPDAKTVMDSSPEPKGRQSLGSIITPVSELIDELRAQEIAPKGGLLAKDTIDYYLALAPNGSNPGSNGPAPTDKELAAYDSLRQRWQQYANDYKLPY